MTTYRKTQLHQIPVGQELKNKKQNMKLLNVILLIYILNINKYLSRVTDPKMNNSLLETKFSSATAKYSL